jgi:hypothetical protein
MPLLTAQAGQLHWHDETPLQTLLARDSTPDRHSAIADDLHRRARSAHEMSPD